jgi:hypothetical protein
MPNLTWMVWMVVAAAAGIILAHFFGYLVIVWLCRAFLGR